MGKLTLFGSELGDLRVNREVVGVNKGEMPGLSRKRTRNGVWCMQSIQNGFGEVCMK